MTTDGTTSQGQEGADPLEPLPAVAQQESAPPSPTSEPSVEDGDAAAESAGASGGG